MGGNVAYRPGLVNPGVTQLVRPNVGAFSFAGNAPTTGSTSVNVSTGAQLETALANANALGGNQEIVLADGTYTISNAAAALVVTADNITIRSASGNRDNVIIQGDAMSGTANVFFNVRVGGDNFKLRNLTLAGKCRFSAFQIAGEDGANNGLVSNCVIKDSFEHLMKATVSTSGWIIEDCLFMFTAGMAPAQYNGGIDVHRGSNWIVRRNTFKDIASPATSACQHAINFWDGSVSNLIERNKVIDCDRGIGDGLNGNPANDSNIIRNNMCYHSNNSDPFADVQFAVENATNSKVYNNSCFIENSFTWCMEYRFTTDGSEFKNNLCNKQILQRNGAIATLSNNVTNAQANWFMNLAQGDLHLVTPIPVSVADQGATLAQVTDDYDGDSRPQGAGYDIGADEVILVPGIIRPPAAALAFTGYAKGGTPSNDPFTFPLYDTSKITYLGKFTVPNTGSSLNGSAGYEFGSRPGGIAFDPAGNGGLGSIFMSGGPETFDEVISEFTIPTPKTSGTPNRATQLQGFQLTAAGKQGNISQGELGTMCSGLMIYNNRIIESWLSFYKTDTNQTTAYIARNSKSLAGGVATNPVRVGTLTNQRFMAGLGCALPAVWSAAFGGFPAVGGGAGACSISGNYSCGPAMVLFDPDNITGAGAVTGVELSYYQQGDMDGGFGPFSSLWTNNSFHRGTIFLPESRTVLCFGKHGDSTYNGENQSVVQVRTRFWLYDAVELKKVFDGTLSPRNVRPYATFDINQGPDNSVPQDDQVRSATWDPVGRKMYVMASHEDGSFPAIFVWSIPV